MSWRTGEGSGFGRGARLPGRLELAGSLSRGRAAAVARYLPLGVPEAARRYVQGAVVDGRVAGATFKVKGDLWDFPFSATAGVPVPAAGGGEFRIVARAEDVMLAYVPSEPGSASPWPPFSRVSGELVFERSSMTIRNAQARAFGVELSRVNGSIADLANPLLHIEGQARGPVADMLRYVGSTPISGWLGDGLREASATGSGELGLVLDIPIDATERTVVQGRLALAGNDVRLTPAMPLLANAKAQDRVQRQGVLDRRRQCAGARRRGHLRGWCAGRWHAALRRPGRGHASMPCDVPPRSARCRGSPAR